MRPCTQGLQVTGKSDVKGLAWVSCKTPNDLLGCFTKVGSVAHAEPRSTLLALKNFQRWK